MGQVSGPSRFAKHALAVAVAGVPAMAAAQTFTVTTLAADGAGSLAAAITAANEAAGADDIVFDVSGTISLGASTLPVITDALSISGNVTLDGGGSASAGPVLQADLVGEQLSLSGLRFRNAPRGVVHVDVSESGGASLSALSMVALASQAVPATEPLVRIAGGTSTLDDARIERNHLGGPAIVVDGGTLDITDTLVSGNTSDGAAAVLGAYEGAVVTVAQSRVLSNTNSGEGAGAMTIHDSTLSLLESELKGNRALSEALESAGIGGAVYAYDSDVLVENSTLASNRAAASGGAIAQQGGSLTIAGSVIEGNRVPWIYGAGGAVSVEAGDATITSTRFENNQAGLGGALRAADAEVAIAGSYFSGNRSSAGGALALFEGTDLSLQSSALSGNTVVDDLLPTSLGGGGLLAIQAGDIAVADSVIRNNSSTKYGGGLFVSSVDSLLLEDTTVSGNTAVVGGSMAISSTADVVMSRLLATRNTADGAGGTFFISVPDNGSALLEASTFSDSRSDNGAAAFVTVGESATLAIAGVTISGNQSTRQPALLVSGTGDYAALSIENTTVSGNRASNTRAAVVLESLATASLVNVTAVDNRASLGDSTQIFVPGRLNPESPPQISITQSVMTSSNDHELILGGSVLPDNGGYGLDLWLDATLSANILEAGLMAVGENTELDNTFGDISVDPMLGTLADNGGYTKTHAPDAASPAIGLADNDRPDLSDQRGATQLGVADAGAVEYSSNRPPRLVTNLAAKLAVAPGKALPPLDVAGAFEDPDGDDVTVVAVRGLPAGLSYDEPGDPGKGVITGTPQQSGRYRVTVEVTDDATMPLTTVAVADVVIGAGKVVFPIEDDDSGSVPLSVLALAGALTWLRRRGAAA